MKSITDEKDRLLDAWAQVMANVDHHKRLLEQHDQPASKRTEKLQAQAQEIKQVYPCCLSMSMMIIGTFFVVAARAREIKT